MWVARDSDGELWLFRNKPHKTYSVWESDGESMPIRNDSLDHVRWDDDEPEIVDLVSRKRLISDDALGRIIAKSREYMRDWSKRVGRATEEEIDRQQQMFNLLLEYYERKEGQLFGNSEQLGEPTTRRSNLKGGKG